MCLTKHSFLSFFVFFYKERSNCFSCFLYQNNNYNNFPCFLLPRIKSNNDNFPCFVSFFCLTKINTKC